MNDKATSILSAIERGDPTAADEILPPVYNELWRLAARRLAHERPGPTLQPTALVREACLRLVGSGAPARWDGCGHFFATADSILAFAGSASQTWDTWVGAESAQAGRILVERARRNRNLKRGGGRRREPADLDDLLTGDPAQDVLALHEALEQFAAHDPVKAKLVEMRFFGGLTLEQTAEYLSMSPSTAKRGWRYARAWLYNAMAGPDSGEK
jgi:hypothetical protein